MITGKDSARPWLFTGFYGHPDKGKKDGSWDLLKRRVLEQCEIRDIPSVGQSFSWSNNRRGEGHIKEKLDRALANKPWLDLFNEANCNVMAAVKITLQSTSECQFKSKEIGENKKSSDMKPHGRVWMGKNIAESMRKRQKRCQVGLMKWKKVKNQHENQDLNQIWAKISQLQDKGDGNHVNQMLALQKQAETVLEENDLK
ncbi:uncharacterized protein LOC122282256 [Carya illinoinensis]|uniref:uncharacterized protein LOC122282256 n=1 Tax=Carya illinoinensis TaxID=32201 RepID=UPI001C718472|nr:uncharacterized protein LOC122282256 [Carya illinoinensis]